MGKSDNTHLSPKFLNFSIQIEFQAMREVNIGCFAFEAWSVGSGFEHQTSGFGDATFRP
jgi:hypothetical protein